MLLVSSVPNETTELTNTYFDAIHRGDTLSVALCLEAGVNIHATEPEQNRTGLMIAIEKGHVSLVDLLLDFKPNLYLKDNDGQTAMAYALLARGTLMLEKIVAAGFGINYAAVDSFPALYLAVYTVDEEKIDFLLAHGAIPNRAYGNNECAYTIALEMEDEDPAKARIIQKLKDHWNN